MKVVEASVESIYETKGLSDKPWGDVDKSELLKAVMDKPSLAKKIYLKVEPDWQEKPSERLSYPIADKSGTVYRYGLASAMTYAKANNETEVINKLKKLYKEYFCPKIIASGKFKPLGWNAIWTERKNLEDSVK